VKGDLDLKVSGVILHFCGYGKADVGQSVPLRRYKKHALYLCVPAGHVTDGLMARNFINFKDNVALAMIAGYMDCVVIKAIELLL
jgi:hypothetical protein